MATLLPNDEVSREDLRGYRIFIWSHDHPHPPHVHFRKGKQVSSWDLESGTCVDEDGFSSSDIRLRFWQIVARRSWGVGMPTGNGTSSNVAANALRGVAAGLRFDADRLFVQLDDGREVSVPLSRYPSLQDADPEQRAAWESIGPGKGFHWEELDLDLSVECLLQGIPEGIPRPPTLARSGEGSAESTRERGRHIDRRRIADWVLEALEALGGVGSTVEVARSVWQSHEDEIRSFEDLLYRWQYEIRGAADILRREGKLVSSNRRWQLPADRIESHTR
jgi:hypothetical protein